MENKLAGLGEGVKGLVAKWRAYAASTFRFGTADSRERRGILAGMRDQARDCANELETALGAAARLPAAPDVHWAIKAQCAHCVDGYPERQEQDDYISNLGPVSVGEWFHHGMINSSSGVVECAAKYIHEALFAAALATPSPQAPRQESAFSPTSAREQSAATASNEPSVGYSEDSAFSVNYAVIRGMRREREEIPKTPVDEPKNDDRAYGCYTCGKQGLKKGQRVSLVYCNECDAKHIEEVRRAAATQEPAGRGDAIRETAVTWLGEHKKAWSAYDLFSLIRIMQSGSPRKVGEDGAQENRRHGIRTWLLGGGGGFEGTPEASNFSFEGLIDYIDAFAELACKELVTRLEEGSLTLRSSSVPVGEQP